MKCKYCGDIISHYDMGHECQAKKDAKAKAAERRKNRKSVPKAEIRELIDRMRFHGRLRLEQVDELYKELGL